MLFFPVVASFFAFGALSAVASPAPVVQKRSDVSDVLSVCVDLEAQVNVVLPKLDSLLDSDSCTSGDIEPLAVKLVDTLNTASAKLDALKGKVDSKVGGTKDEVAKKIAAIYTDILKSLDHCKTKKPQFYPIFVKHGIEGALIKVLNGLEAVLGGVLLLVGTLLKAVGSLLGGLSFVLLKVLCGL